MATTTWQPIQDLPQNWEGMRSDALRCFGEIWHRERVTRLESDEALREFNARLSREWAIETGIIEGLYTIDRGTTQNLIEHGIVESLLPHNATNRLPSRVVDILRDHEEALEGVFAFVKQQRQLSTSYIKEIHAALTQNQLTTDAFNSQGQKFETELLRGAWKIHPNNPTRPNGSVHQYCPPEHVASEMNCLVALHEEHEGSNVSPEVEAAWLHHRFTQIHPFQDGNGRVARILASLVFLRAGWFPLIIDRDQRVSYIDALEAADAQDMNAIVQLFSTIQDREFFHAFVEIDSISKVEINDAQNKYSLRSSHESQQVTPDIALVELLRQFSYSRVNSNINYLKSKMQVSDEVTLTISVESSRNSEIGDQEFAATTAAIANEQKYFANTPVFGAWTKIFLKEEIEAEFTISFHGFGKNFDGLFAVSAFIEFSSLGYRGLRRVRGPYSVNEQAFLFSQDEEISSATKRFQAWFDATITSAIDRWQRQL